MSTLDAALTPREISGPSAFGGGWRRMLHLTWLIASTDFKLSYFGSALGYLWSLMRPLLFFGVLYLVFAKVAHVGKGIQDYPVLLLLNLVLFSFFQEATGASVASVVVRESLVRKMHFPRIVIPLATVLTSTLNLLVNLIAVFAFLLIYGIEPQWTWLLLPLILVPLIALAAGTAMILSSLYVRYRDIAPIWSVVSQMLFYVSPLFYVALTVPAKYRVAYLSNPIAALLTQARHWIIDPSAPTLHGLMGWPDLLLPVAIGIAICVYGVWIFTRMAPQIAEEL
jgi:ABC-2 type transport system permease protein